MSRHWPLGTGSYARAFVHSGLALATAACLLIYAEYMGGISRAEWALGEVAGICSLALFTVLALQGARLTLFRPGVLAALVATPASEADIHHILDPMRSIIYRALPYVLGIAATLPFQRRGSITDLLAIASACLALRLALPLLALASLLLRRVLVPFGHWLVWLVAGATIISVVHERPVVGQGLARLLLGFGDWAWQGYLVTGMLCAALAYPARVLCRAAAERLLRRDELRALAFPVHAERAAKPRRTVMEAIGGSRRLRHFAFLLQEATGLYRPLDWCKAAAVWVAAIVVALSLARRGSGPWAHVLVTLAPMAALLAWGAARHIRLGRLKFLWVLGEYGLPVGHLGLFWTRAIALFVAYVLTSMVSVIRVTALPPTHHSGATVTGLAAMLDLAQLWLAMFAAGALVSAAWRAKDTRGSLAGLLAWVWFNLFLVLFAAGWLWTIHTGQGYDKCAIGNGMRMAVAKLWAACTGHSSPDVLVSHWAGSPFRHLLGWQFDALGWWLLAVMVWASLSLLWRAGRGRAHSRYRSHRPEGRPPAPFFRRGAAR